MQVYPRVACILMHIEAHTALSIPIANNFSVVDQLAPMILKFSVNSDRAQESRILIMRRAGILPVYQGLVFRR